MADVPTKSWALQHYGHTSSDACPRCKVQGIHDGKRMIFLGINHPLRTDEEYRLCSDEDHHKGPSPLLKLPMGLTTQSPGEYMHLLCIGFDNKFETALVTKHFGVKIKLSCHIIGLISKRFLVIESYTPSEFARKIESLTEKMKATQNRQRLLYSGVVCYKRLIDEDAYDLYSLMHAATRSLCQNEISEKHLQFSKMAYESSCLMRSICD